jgi:hypothetical protein
MEDFIDNNMNVYYQKYIKYKTKYLEIKYGAGKSKKKKKSPASAASAAPETPVKLASAAPETPVKLASAAQATPSVQITPQQFSIVKTPESNFSTSSDVAVKDSPPTLVIQYNSLNTLIEKKDDLVSLLSACPELSNYDITSRSTSTGHLYINFKKKVERKNVFAHFSFHYPADEVESDIYDMFVPNTFHLRLDKYRQIVFNLILDQHEKLVLESKTEEQDIICIITELNYDELIKIKNCLEKILNIPEYKGIILNPTARQLF